MFFGCREGFLYHSQVVALVIDVLLTMDLLVVVNCCSITGGAADSTVARVMVSVRGSFGARFIVDHLLGLGGRHRAAVVKGISGDALQQYNAGKVRRGLSVLRYQ